MARRKKRGGENTAPKNVNNGAAGVRQDVLDALSKGKYGQLTGRTPQYTKSNEQNVAQRRVPSLNGIKPISAPKNTEQKTEQKKTEIPKQDVKTEAPKQERKEEPKKTEKKTKKTVTTSNMEFTKDLKENKAKPILSEKQSDLVKTISSEKKTVPVMDDKQKKLAAKVESEKAKAPKPSGVASTRRSKEEMSMDKAMRYQQSLEDEAKKYSFNEETKANNTLDKKDLAYAQRLVDQFGESDLTRESILEKARREGWEEKYNKPIEQIYDDLIADQGNIRMERGKEHPILSEAGTVLGNVPISLISTLPSLAANAIAPESEFAKKAEEARSKAEENRRYLREGVKENTGDTGDKIIDTVNAVGDRMVNTSFGKLLGGNVLGGVMAGLSDANQQMENLNLRPDMDARRKALTALAHGGVEGLGTAITTGLLDKIPALNGIGGRLLNVGKGAGNAAIENSISEAVEMGLDSAINGENSQKQLNKALYMLNGMSEEEAEKQSWIDVAKQAGNAALTGALFGGGMQGLKEVSDVAKSKIPDLYGRYKSGKLEREIGTNEDIRAILNDEVSESTPEVDNARVRQEAEQIAEQRNLEAERAQAERAQSDMDTLRQMLAEQPEKLQTPMEKLGANLDEKVPQTQQNQGSENLQEGMGKPGNLDPTEEPLPTWDKYEVDSIMDNDGSEKFFVVGKNNDGTMDFAEKGVYYNSKKEARAAIKALKNGERTVKAEAPVEQEAENLQPEAEKVPETPEEITEPIVNSEEAPAGQQPLVSDTVSTNSKGESDVVTNSAINAGIIRRYDYDNDPVLREIAEYDKHSNEKTYNAALENVRRNGAQLLDEYNSDRRLIDNDTDVDQAMILLRNLNEQIKSDPKSAKELTAQRNMLLSRLRKAGTKWGESIQAFAKWNDTPDGALINGEKMNNDRVKVWKSRNQKQVAQNEKVAADLDNIGREIPEGDVKTDEPITTRTNARMDRALRMQGNDGTIEAQPKAPKTHEEIRAEVTNSLNKELGSIAKNLTETDIEYYTNLIENKVPIGDIVSEIEHRLNYGEFYTLDESIPEPKPLHSKLLSALNSLVETEEEAPKQELSIDELRNQVRNTLERESASIGEFTDEDVDYIANLIQNGATKEELAQALDTKMATGKFGISAETQTKVNRLFELADHYDPNSKEAVQAKAAAYRLIADEVIGDAAPFEKFEAWRYLAMLGNPKTMLRNFVGNALFNATTGVSNTLSAALEAGVDNSIKLTKKGLNKAFNTNFDTSKGIERTKSVLIPGKDHALIKGAWEDAPSHRYAQLNGGKYEKSGVRDKIAAEKSVYNSKFMRLYEKAVDAGINDYPAIRTKYSTSLAGWMKANGLDEKAFDAEPRYKNLQAESKVRVLTDAERAEMADLKKTMDLLEKGRDYAIDQAEYATFHEDNAIAKALSKATNSLIHSDNKATRAFGYMIEGVVPFKKTPANILRSGIEYSPLGAINSIAKTGKLIYENTGKRKGNLGDTYTKKSMWRGNEKEVQRTLANEVIDSWSKTLTGSGLAMLGYYLKSKGILNSSEADEKYQDDLEGIQNYSITINGKTYTLDWAAPAVMPLLLGAEIKKTFDRNAIPDKKWYTDTDEIVGSVNALLEPIFETSMMQGVQNVFESAANASRYGNGKEAVGGVLGSVAANALTGYYTQALPTVLGQVARTVDPVRRSTDTATDSSFLAGIEKQGRKLMNKTPFLSKFNTPYVDARGEEQTNSPFNNVAGNLAYQTLSPSYIRDIDTRESDTMARNVYNATTFDENGNEVPIRDKDVFAPWKSRITYGGEKFSPEQMYTYRTESGKASEEIRTALAKEPWFNNLDGQKQTDILKKVNSLVNKIGLEANGYEQDDKALDAYKQSIPALMNYYRGNQFNKTLQNAGISTSSKLADNAKEALNTGGEEAAQKVISEGLQERDRAKELGFVDKDGSINVDQYNKVMANAGDNRARFERDIPVLKQANLNRDSYDFYLNAIKNHPELSASEFARKYNEIDTNKANKLIQDEMMAYIIKNYKNPSNLTEAQMNAVLDLWQTYSDGTWKQVPYVKKDGTWSKHTPNK